jgi:hypothetical protein
MKITIKRTHHLHEATLGQLFIEDVKTDLIYTLENPERETDKDNRIPSGVYQCKPYSGTKYKDVYIVENVPGRSAILLHWGNTEKDTQGCILLGNRLGELNGQPAVLESKRCFDRFRSIVGKNEFTLEIRD